MFIQTELTPNPNAIKFLPEVEISPSGPVFFESKEEAEDAVCGSELALKLLMIEGIEAVFFGRDFITVTKSETSDWNFLRPEILMVVVDHLSAGFPIFNNAAQKQTKYDDANLTNIEKEIIEIIETRVRPSVAMDGGNITYKGFENGVVFLELRGACSGCPSSSVTLKNGIESMLKHFIPEVKSVEAISE